MVAEGIRQAVEQGAMAVEVTGPSGVGSAGRAGEVEWECWRQSETPGPPGGVPAFVRGVCWFRVIPKLTGWGGGRKVGRRRAGVGRGWEGLHPVGGAGVLRPAGRGAWSAGIAVSVARGEGTLGRTVAGGSGREVGESSPGGLGRLEGSDARAPAAVAAVVWLQVQ